MHVSHNPLSEKEEKPIVISFLRQDLNEELVHENDQMVIKVQIHDWRVKRVVIGSGSLDDILY